MMTAQLPLMTIETKKIELDKIDEMLRLHRGTSFIFHTTNEAEQKHGLYQIYDKGTNNHVLIEEGYFENGILEGMRTLFNEDGTVTRKPYKNGKIEGTVRRTAKDGTELDAVEYVNDKRHGLSKTTYGNVQFGTYDYVEAYYKDDALHGLYCGIQKREAEDPMKWIKGPEDNPAIETQTTTMWYDKGCLDGEMKTTCYDGTICTSHWKKGERSGPEEIVYPDGHSVKKLYKKGKLNGLSETVGADKSCRFDLYRDNQRQTFASARMNIHYGLVCFADDARFIFAKDIMTPEIRVERQKKAAAKRAGITLDA